MRKNYKKTGILKKIKEIEIEIDKYIETNDIDIRFRLSEFFTNYTKKIENFAKINDLVLSSNSDYPNTLKDFLFFNFDKLFSTCKTKSSFIEFLDNNKYVNIKKIINEMLENEEYKNYINLKSELQESNSKLISNNNYINDNIEVQIRNITQFLYKGNITDIDFEKKTFKIKLKSTTSSIVQNFFRKFPIKFAKLCITNDTQEGLCSFNDNEMIMK